jgi:hypothetical protein
MLAMLHSWICYLHSYAGCQFSLSEGYVFWLVSLAGSDNWPAKPTGCLAGWLGWITGYACWPDNVVGWLFFLAGYAN